MLESQMTFTTGFLSSEYGEEEYFFATDRAQDKIAMSTRRSKNRGGDFMGSQ